MALASGTRRFGISTHLRVVSAIAMLFFVGLALALQLQKGSTGPLVAALCGSAIFCGFLASLRLEISRSWFKTASLVGSHTIHFGHVTRAWIEVTRMASTPQGVAVFWIKLHNGQALKIPLRVFPVQAAAQLFSSLEAHGIQVEVADAWAARRMSDQVRTAQARARLD